MSDLIQVRRGTSAQWAAANPILAEGEPGFDTTSGDFKIGNGITPWASLTPPANTRYVAAPTAWTAVTFTNSWVDFGAPAQVCQYRLIGDVVTVRGAMKSGTIPAIAFTLPVGFRPPATLSFTTISNSLLGFIIVDSAGAVTAQSGSNVIFNLNGVEFSVTA